MYIKIFRLDYFEQWIFFLLSFIFKFILKSLSSITYEIVNVVVIPLLIYLAEWERSILIERINNEIKNMPQKSRKRYSRKTGNVIGRPVKVLNLSKEEQDMLKRVRDKEISVKSFCRFMQISRSSYYKYYRNSYLD